MVPDAPLSLWAKKASVDDVDAAAFHPLLCHLLDVGAVAAHLWVACLPASARQWFAQQLGLDVESAGRWATFLSAYHDLGKGSPAFQERQQFSHPAKHGTISTHLLRSALQEPPFNITSDVAHRLATIVGGHHGVFPRA